MTDLEEVKKHTQIESRLREAAQEARYRAGQYRIRVDAMSRALDDLQSSDEDVAYEATRKSETPPRGGVYGWQPR